MKFQRIVALAIGASFCAALSVPAYASPMIDLGVTGWDAQASGQGTSTQGGQNSTVDAQSDLGLQRQWTGGAYFVFRHDIPVVPDFMVSTSHVFNDGSNTINRTITWQGKTFQANGLVQSQIKLDTDRLVAFWNPLDNPLVNLRLGLEARHVSLDVALTGTVQQQGGGTQRESATEGGSAWLPMGYAGITFYLPGGVHLGGGWSYIGYSGSHLSDYHVQASYHFSSGFYIDAGYRRYDARLDSSNFSLKADLNFKGVYAGVGYAF